MRKRTHCWKEVMMNPMCTKEYRRVGKKKKEGTVDSLPSFAC